MCSQLANKFQEPKLLEDGMKMEMVEQITNRRGLIRLTYEVLDFPHYNDESHKVFCKLFSMFVPLHIVNNSFLGEIEYYGYCEYFEVVDQNIRAPEYRVIFEKKESGEFDISFKRKGSIINNQLSQKQRQFIVGLEKLTRETGICIDISSYDYYAELVEADTSCAYSGYFYDMSEKSLFWIDPSENRMLPGSWEKYKNGIVK